METDFAILEGIQKALLDGQELGWAIQKLRVFIHNHPFLRVGSQFEDIVTNYQLMKEYMLKGFKDEQREKLYRNLLCRMVRLVNDIYLRLQIEKGIGTFAQAYNKTDKMNFSFDSITETLEGFVQDFLWSRRTAGVTSNGRSIGHTSIIWKMCLNRSLSQVNGVTAW